MKPFHKNICVTAPTLVSWCAYRKRCGYCFCWIIVCVFGILLLPVLQPEHTRDLLGPSTRIQNRESWYPLTALVTLRFHLPSAEVEQM